MNIDGLSIAKSIKMKIGDRQRRIIKGAHLVTYSELATYLNEDRIVDNIKAGRRRMLNRDRFHQFYSKDLNVYLLSHGQLKLSRRFNYLNTRNITRNGKRLRPVLRRRSRSGQTLETTPRNMSPFTPTMNENKFCGCRKLMKRGRARRRFLIMANILETKGLEVKFTPNDKTKKRREFPIISYSRMLNNPFLRMSSAINKQRRRRHRNGRHLSTQKHNTNDGIKVLYLTYIVPWYKARSFIDYLENDSIDKTKMCQNIDNTLRQIEYNHNHYY
jgi:hypothetical protein